MRVRLHSLVLATLVLCIWKADSLNYCRPSMSCWPSIIELSNFKREMNATGAADVLTKDDSDWPTEGLTFNLAVTEVPGLIVYVESVDTIRKALQFATKYNIEISIISSGHSFPGRCTAKDSMQISVHKMKEITVDMGCEENNLGCLTAQSGVQWGEVYREANRHSRLVVGGSNPTVSVTGWTLGGGHSPMSRMFGLGVDNVISFHLISSDLSEVWASEKGVRTKSIDGSETSSNDTSLFWALRGGGSAFGVIVDITFRMHMDNQIAQMACSYPAYGDGFSETFRVMFNSLGPLLTQAPNTFSGYILPSVGCDPVSRACGGTSVISIVHYGPSNGTADDEWIKKFTDLPHDWIASGLTNGSCFLKEYPSFYDYELSIPNVTYTAEGPLKTHQSMPCLCMKVGEMPYSVSALLPYGTLDMFTRLPHCRYRVLKTFTRTWQGTPMASITMKPRQT
ncbi:uncharacterized protein [Watersipora subatra]|uniref:uncharacterized protein isoform X2 n=1 Tax=Watersipora subatra TaxID=2589382 RepID=UPI00355BCD75